MQENGLKDQISAAATIKVASGREQSKKTPIGDHTGIAQFRLSGCGDMQGYAIRRPESNHMPESDSMDKNTSSGEHQHQLSESRYEPTVHKAAFWLDVVPGV